MSQSTGATALRGQLARWTAAGLIDAEQASRIEVAEAEAPTAKVAPRTRLPWVAEALGYLGAVIAIAASAVAVGNLWKFVPPSTELAFTGVVTVGLITVGAVLRIGGEPAFARLRGVLWLIAIVSVASFVAVLTASYAHMEDSNVALLSTAAALTCAIPLWWRHRSALQQIALFASAAAVVAAGVYRIVPTARPWQLGLGVWALSVLWGFAADRGYLAPRTTGLASACTGMLVGAIAASGPAAGQALVVATAVALLAAGIALNRVMFMGFGAVGTIWAVPETAVRYLRGSVAAPVAVAAVGLVLLGAALWLAKIHRKA
jgi:hypothetical protein